MQRARRIVFGETSDHSIDDELHTATEVDRAHIVMLHRQNLLNRESASLLLREIDRLRASDFTPLRGKFAPRGMYMLYEAHLIATLGDEVGGMLQTGRSRNDLNATVTAMRLRVALHALLREALRLQAVVLRRANRDREVIMPAFTHYQPAVPITVGHYWLGFAAALDRDLAALQEANESQQACPLGAGAVGGTSLPIDAALTARLLGFDRAVLNSVDAVASRDQPLRVLAALSILGVLLSRIATDLLQWTSGEDNLFALPDELVGKSSMMPQKRNAFFLEHVQGFSTTSLGLFTAAAAAMHAKPFSNAISVDTRGVEHVWPGLESAGNALILLRTVVGALQPQRKNMARRATRGFTAATEIANQLVVREGYSYRSAYHAVAELVQQTRAKGSTDLASAAHELYPSLGNLDPEEVSKISRFGGGPGDGADALQFLSGRWRDHMVRQRVSAGAWRNAAFLLEESVQDVETER